MKVKLLCCKASTGEFYVTSVIAKSFCIRDELEYWFGFSCRPILQKRVIFGSDYPFPLGDLEGGKIVENLTDSQLKVRRFLFRYISCELFDLPVCFLFIFCTDASFPQKDMDKKQISVIAKTNTSYQISGLKLIMSWTSTVIDELFFLLFPEISTVHRTTSSLETPWNSSDWKDPLLSEHIVVFASVRQYRFLGLWLLHVTVYIEQWSVIPPALACLWMYFELKGCTLHVSLEVYQHKSRLQHFQYYLHHALGKTFG